MPFQRPNTNNRPEGAGEINYQTIVTVPAKRRVTQIAVTYDHEVQEDRLFALCDDGSVWVMVWDGDDNADRSHWGRLADIPQE